MDNNKVELFILTNRKYFATEHISSIRERLLLVSDDKWPMIQTLDFKDPTINLIISVIVGEFGIDRFLIGDITLGIIKLITCGGFGIWWIVDWILIMGATKEKNLAKLQAVLY